MGMVGIIMKSHENNYENDENKYGNDEHNYGNDVHNYDNLENDANNCGLQGIIFARFPCLGMRKLMSLEEAGSQPGG